MNATDSRQVLSAKAVSKLTDAAQAFFSTMYDLERAREELAKARLKAVLGALDLFAAEPNHEDYVPGGGPEGP